MAFREGDEISIIILKPNKQYGANKCYEQFPQKGWSLGGLKKKD